MELVISDPAIVQQLRQAQTTVKLIDYAGNVIGRFVPKPAAPEEPPITEEELRRRAQEPGRPLADILADLEKRA
jgi:hypothetical protein